MNNEKIAVVGLGYVGLPLAVALAGKYSVVGFDISSERVASLKQGMDVTQEISPTQLNSASGLTITSDASDTKGCDIFIVTVPTPIDDANRPDAGRMTQRRFTETWIKREKQWRKVARHVSTIAGQ